MERLNCNLIIPATHDEWLAERSKGIGSSDAGTIMGVNSYTTIYQLWRKRKGLDAPVEETEDMRRGHYCEESVAQWFAGHTGYNILEWSKPDIILVDKEREYLRVSPDRIFEYKDGSLGVLECKTTKSRSYSPENYPKSWFCQVQYQLGVSGLRQGAIACMNADFDFWTIPIYFDEDFYNMMIGVIEDNWNRYFVGEETPPLSTGKDVALKFIRSTPERCQIAQEGTLDDIKVYKDKKAQIKALESELKVIEDRLKVQMGDAERLTDTNGETWVTFKSRKQSVSFDTKTFEKKEPDKYKELFEKYNKTSAPSRVFEVVYDGGVE